MNIPMKLRVPKQGPEKQTDFAKMPDSVVLWWKGPWTWSQRTWKQSVMAVLTPFWNLRVLIWKYPSLMGLSRELNGMKYETVLCDLLREIPKHTKTTIVLVRIPWERLFLLWGLKPSTKDHLRKTRLEGHLRKCSLRSGSSGKLIFHWQKLAPWGRTLITWSSWTGRPRGGEGPVLRCDRTYQVALFLPHAGGTDHVILFSSPVSKSTEKIVR